ncbi:unnamed protein product [Caenorhabditis auriculariae]|uniref:Uncharacterized protein n=1 Tax=Caenorhabditis auriculariae TaxID=2777116 RepID=A0A8S1HQP3_9PELO|nr:unnamed protein product [Caenorhabditis auriculariae]
MLSLKTILLFLCLAVLSFALGADKNLEDRETVDDGVFEDGYVDNFNRAARSGKPTFIRFGKRAGPSFIRFGRAQPSFIRFGRNVE